MSRDASAGIFSTAVETAFLVGVVMPGGDEAEAEASLRELAGLADTMGLSVVGSAGVKLREVNSRFFIGSGRAEEIADAAQEAEADCIIFDRPLSPSQQRNWETRFGLCVIDREEVIIDIFAGRARTKEAVLQVALARQEYSLPRLTRAWTHLSRQRGGSKATRDSGETQLETDRRIVLNKIARLKREIAAVKADRSVMRKRRTAVPVPSVSVIGYTNAGKSSLLNALSGADVFVEDRLFATLDPTSRRVTFDNGSEAVVTDTVGFIRNLPHHLIDAFRSTLEETLEADLLVHLIDASDPDCETHIRVTESVLADLGAAGKRTLTVFNKTDACDGDTVSRLRRLYPEALFISVKEREGWGPLKTRIAEELSALFTLKTVRIPYSRYALAAQIRREGRVIEERFDGDAVVLKAYIPNHLGDLF